MKIRYVISHGVARWVEFDRSDKDALTLSVTPKCRGTVSLGTMILPLEHGEVTIPLSALADGTYTPIVECTDGVYAADNFKKMAKGIVLPENASEATRDLIVLCQRLGSRAKLLEERVSALEELCRGHNIFNYERKENEKQA